MMTKREWYRWANQNKDVFARAGLTARQVTILASAYRNYKDKKDNGRLYLPIILPDGVLAEFGGEEVQDLIDKGLIMAEISGMGAKSVKITKDGIESLEKIFEDIEELQKKQGDDNMNVISYRYYAKQAIMPQFLYVDADYDKDKFPANVREIIEKSERPNPVGFAVIQRIGEAAVGRFKARHYLDAVFDMVEHS